MQKYFLIALISCAYFNAHAQTTTKFTSIDTAAFQNSAHHWYDITEPENIINARPNQPRFKPTEIKAIADNVLLYQKSNGGWPKNYDMRAILTNEQKQLILATKDSTNTTFDNSTTYSHVNCLADVYHATKSEKYKLACLKGLDFIFTSQYANGGWPQFYPLRNDYSRCITFNDDVIVGNMAVMKRILDNDPSYAFVDAERRKKAKVAFDKGMSCILALQIKDDGKLTAWAQQYDEVSLAPAWARKYEPPCICNRESGSLVLFLMTIKNPSKELITAIQSAVKWFQDSKILYTRVKTIPAPTIKYKVRTSSTDKMIVIDSTAPPIWTRYYELGTHRPLFCNRDSKVVYSLAEVERERRDGYGWYVYDPQDVFNKYRSWQKKYAPKDNVLKKH